MDPAYLESEVVGEARRSAEDEVSKVVERVSKAADWGEQLRLEVQAYVDERVRSLGREVERFRREIPKKDKRRRPCS